MRLTRRRALEAAGLAALSTACAARRPVTALAPAGPRPAPIDVRPERVIRTICGLRPYRSSGFVLRPAKVGSKDVVHNYGHGGAGITLSWGAAQLALEEALKTGHRSAAVIGCVIGLSTARLLHTTSNVAGGLWTPVTVFDPARATREFLGQFERACRISFRRYQDLTGERYGVRWLPIYVLGAHPSGMFREDGPLGKVLDVFPDRRTLGGAENPFATPHATRYLAMVIEPAIYLNALIQDFFAEGGRVAQREFANAAALVELPEPLLMNCTGLGSRALFGDTELTPVKGQLWFLPPQPDVDYCTIGPGSLYMFPRRDGILLGGTHEEGNWSLEPDPAQTERMVNGNRELLSRGRPPAT